MIFRLQMLIKVLTIVLFLTTSAFSFSKTPPPVAIPKVEKGQPLPQDLFIQIAKKLNPTVVNISTRIKNNPLSGYNPILDLFSIPGPQVHPHNQPLPPHSLGSGFILEEDGHIVTNAHVILKADTIHVQIKDDPTTYDARVIGKDAATDIALIKIDAKSSRTRKKFPTVDIGRSNNLQVGEWVAAFGNPYGHSNTMTKGIISAVDRHIDELNLLPFLQTDASINPGNSGGPLVNTQGQVIGVNTAINPRAQNIGFAIPIYNVMSILKSLKKDGYVKRGFLGVQMSPTPIEFDYKNKSYSGVLIVNIVKGSPADRGGIRPQDVVIEFNGSPIKSNKDLFKIVAATPVNETVRGKIFRNNEIRTFKVTIKERPRKNNFQSSSAPSSSQPLQSSKSPYNLGFTVIHPRSEIPSDLNIPTTYANRPIVTKVETPSPASRSGMRAGDLIFSVNGNNVRNVEDILKKLSSGRQNVIHVLRFNQPGKYSLKKLTIIR